ncbi:MAG: ACT domain-containing protein, partial [Anaerovoracaceae bacterium]
MLIKQMSVFVENTTGRLAELTRILAEHGIDIKASTIADTVDFGILRCIVPNPEE